MRCRRLLKHLEPFALNYECKHINIHQISKTRSPMLVKIKCNCFVIPGISALMARTCLQLKLVFSRASFVVFWVVHTCFLPGEWHTEHALTITFQRAYLRACAIRVATQKHRNTRNNNNYEDRHLSARIVIGNSPPRARDSHVVATSTIDPFSGEFVSIDPLQVRESYERLARWQFATRAKEEDKRGGLTTVTEAIVASWKKTKPMIPSFTKTRI